MRKECLVLEIEHDWFPFLSAYLLTPYSSELQYFDVCKHHLFAMRHIIQISRQNFAHDLHTPFDLVWSDRVRWRVCPGILEQFSSA